MGVEAFEAECAAKVEARAAQEAARAAGALSRKEQKNQSYWQRRNQRKKASRGCQVMYCEVWSRNGPICW